MKQDGKLADCMIDAIGKVEDFITQASGVKPTPEELASALSKYFVLKEIAGFVELARQEEKRTD